MSELASEKLSGTIELLTKDNYKTWRMKAEALLDVFSLWDYVSGDIRIPSKNAAEQELWKTNDKRAKSMLILQISDALLPLVEYCKTSNEIWLKLENVYGNKRDSIESSEIDEDTIINDIEESVEEFFETINDTSDKEKKSLNFADKLLLRLEKNGLKKLPDKKIIAAIVDQFITGVIEKLSKTEIKDQKTELSGKLIDNLLLKFDINPHKNDNDDATSNGDVVEAPEKTVNSGKKGDSDGDKMNRILLKAIDALAENKIANNDYSKCNPLHERTSIQRELCGERGGCRNDLSPNLYTPPQTPSPRQARKCGVCRQEGHNRTTCPLNKPVTPASKSAARSTSTPSTPRKCGICGLEGHNRTTCSLNKTVSPASKSSSQTVSTPSRSYSCGMCGVGGHNRTTCPLNKTVASPSQSLSRSVSSTPSRSYSCGACGSEGHNRTTCPLLRSNTPSPQSYATSTPIRSYSCGTCGGQGHNSRTCSAGRSNSSSYSSYSSPSYSYSAPSPSYSGGARRSYTCGNCGGLGHNSRTCSG